MFLFCLVFKIPVYPHLSGGLTNTEATGGLGPLSSQTQEIVIVGLSEIGMANPMWGEGKSLFFFFLILALLSND